MNREAENWLLERLKTRGVDVYVDGSFASLRDRLAYVIVSNNVQARVAGYRNKRPETYRSVFERIYNVEVESIVPRETFVSKQSAGRG